MGWIGSHYIDGIISLGIYLYKKCVFKLIVEGQIRNFSKMIVIKFKSKVCQKTDRALILGGKGGNALISKIVW